MDLVHRMLSVRAVLGATITLHAKTPFRSSAGPILDRANKVPFIEYQRYQQGSERA